MPLRLPLTCILLAAACFAAFVGPATAADGVPKVVLSEKHQAMCKVKVGDAMPGSPKLGKQATVVVFTHQGGWMTRQLLKDLGPDIEKRFGEQGVTTQIVHPAAKPKQPLAATMVADADGKLFAQVGSGNLPRVYVLDAAGKIVWFDLEYTRSTRRELRQTLEVLTTK